MGHKGKGQATIEMAIALGMLVVLAIGAIQTLYTFSLIRRVRAATEEIAAVAAISGGDTDYLRERVPDILGHYRLDEDLAEVQVHPPAPTIVPYLDPLEVTVRYAVTVRVYGLFDLPIPPQTVGRLSEGG